ncbi:hypothetical protein V8C26DRAFT_116068 [Trichoderma gracile]
MSRARHIKHPAPFPLQTRRFLWLPSFLVPLHQLLLAIWTYGIFSTPAAACHLLIARTEYLDALSSCFSFWRGIFSLFLLPFPTPSSLPPFTLSYQVPPSSSLAHLKSPNPPSSPWIFNLIS